GRGPDPPGSRAPPAGARPGCACTPESSAAFSWPVLECERAQSGAAGLRIVGVDERRAIRIQGRELPIGRDAEVARVDDTGSKIERVPDEIARRHPAAPGGEKNEGRRHTRSL